MFANVWTRWCVVSVGLREVNCGHRWARKDEVNSLRECDDEKIQGDGADVYRKSGFRVLYSLRWEKMWEFESQIRYAMRGSRVCVRVCVDPFAKVDLIVISE